MCWTPTRLRGYPYGHPGEVRSMYILCSHLQDQKENKKNTRHTMNSYVWRGLTLWLERENRRRSPPSRVLAHVWRKI